MVKGISGEISADRIKDAIREYKRSQDRIFKQNHDDYMANIKPGQTVPHVIPLSDKSKKDIDSALRKARNTIDNEINDVLKTIMDDIAEAPSDEAIRALQVANMRTSITDDEIDFMMNKYGKNVQVYSALKDIAVKHKFYNFKPDRTLQQFNELSELSHIMNGFDSFGIEKDPVSQAYVAMLERSVNNAFGLNEEGKAEY